MATRRPTKRMTDLKGLLKRLDELREELGDEKGESQCGARLLPTAVLRLPAAACSALMAQW